MQSLIKFKQPDAKERKYAIGAMGGTPFKVKKALEDVDKYWLPKEPPGESDWLASEFESG